VLRNGQACFSRYEITIYLGHNVLALGAVDRRFEPWLGQTKDYKIDICCFSAKRAALSYHYKIQLDVLV